MKKYDELLEIAEKLNNAKTIEDCGDLLVEINKVEDDYNLLVAVFAMCINKSLYIKIAEINESKDEKYPEIISQIAEEADMKFNAYLEIIKNDESAIKKYDFDEYIEYLKRLIDGILNSFNYQNKQDKHNEWNTVYRREERCRDYMKQFIAENKYANLFQFTKKYGIELPYMYVFVWDILLMADYGIYKKRNEEIDDKETSYVKLLPDNLRIYLKNISDEMLNVIFEDRVFNRNKFEDTNTNAPIKYFKQVYFSELLPCIVEVDKSLRSSAMNNLVDDMRKYISRGEMPYIRKEVYKKVPLVSVEIEKSKQVLKLLELTSDVLKEEQKTKESNSMLKKLNEKLRMADEDKNAMVSDFTHRYGNLAADNLYEKAIALINNEYCDENLKDMGRELLLEYDNKQILAKEVKMLKLEHTNNFEELCSIIEKSKDVNGVGIEKIVDDALKRVLIRILISADEKRIEDVRNKIEKKGIDTWVLLEKYEKDILLDNVSCINWINDNICDIKMSYDDEWKKVRLINKSEGAVFLMGLLMELFYNMLTYASLDKEIIFMFGNAEKFLYIQTANFVDKEMVSYSKKGLDSRNRILSKINYGEEYNQKRSIVITNKDGFFELKAFVKKRYFIDEEMI
jgi:hypothetical protein